MLNILAERSSVEYHEQDLTGKEFKNQVVKALCVLKWSPSILTPLTVMFGSVLIFCYEHKSINSFDYSEMHLSKEDYQIVINKLSQSMDYLTPQELPPFIYQFLELCKNQKSKSLFLSLQRYFDIHNRRNVVQTHSSSSGSEDIIGISFVLESIRKCFCYIFRECK